VLYLYIIIMFWTIDNLLILRVQIQSSQYIVLLFYYIQCV